MFHVKHYFLTWMNQKRDTFDIVLRFWLAMPDAGWGGKGLASGSYSRMLRIPSAPSRQKLEFSAVWFASVQGKILTAMWFHRLEILPFTNVNQAALNCNFWLYNVLMLIRSKSVIVLFMIDANAWQNFDDDVFHRL